MILEQIAEKTKERVAEQKKIISPAEYRTKAEVARAEEFRSKTARTELLNDAVNSEGAGNPFYSALAEPGISFICEVKKASPSKGVIAEHFPYLEIAGEYEEAGANAISVLTEPYFFQGSNEYLKEIRANVSLPILRKDFTVDEYMIYEAKAIGADAVLLICSILSQEQLNEYRLLAKELGLAALVEAHDEREVEMALKAGAEIIGVNNRNLNLSRGIIDAAQLHGNESEGTIRFLRRTSGKPVIKAVVVRQPEDILKWKDTEADYLLLDSGKGSGETFRWSLMEDAVGESEIAFEKSIFLAGGIHPGNIHEAIRNVHPYCIDVSSGAETDGVKDPVKMKALVEAVRNIGV